jgi:DsbC/DsbD-like thiol-disulfide interchange protein
MRLAWALIAATVLAVRVAAAADPVTAALRLENGRAVVDMTIASGWHVNAHAPRDRFLIPTTLELTPPSGVRAGDVQYPTPIEKALEFSEGKMLQLYEGRQRLEATIDGTPADATPLRAKLRYQACDATTCLPPRTLELTAALPAAARATP